MRIHYLHHNTCARPEPAILTPLITLWSSGFNLRIPQDVRLCTRVAAKQDLTPSAIECAHQQRRPLGRSSLPITSLSVKRPLEMVMASSACLLGSRSCPRSSSPSTPFDDQKMSPHHVSHFVKKIRKLINVWMRCTYFQKEEKGNDLKYHHQRE